MFRRSQNRVVIEGYLKDNTLKREVKPTEHGNIEVINGAMTIVTSEQSEYRVQFYTQRWKKVKPGFEEKQENPMFARLANVTADKTYSFAKHKEQNPSDEFSSVKGIVTKVYCVGSFQEFLRKDANGNPAPIVTIRGMSAGVAKNETFNPHARFEVEVYVDSITKEMKKNPETEELEETGRLKLLGLIPEYDGSVSEIPFVTGDDDVASFISENFKRGQTIFINGDIVNLVTHRTIEAANTGKTFGRRVEPTVVTEFVNERRIMGGSTEAYESTDELGFSIADIKEGRAIREQKLEEAPLPSSNAAPTGGFVAPKANKASIPQNFSNIDF